MDTNNYKTAYAVVFEKQKDSQVEMRDGLRAIGFGEVEIVDSRAELERKLRVRPPDLLFCGCRNADDEICGFLHEIRAGNVAANPFLAILVASWSTNRESIGAHRNAGADASISFPVSHNGLAETVGLLITNRKRFVATADYIGPDRRRDPSRSGSECFDVLNSLGVKALGLTAGETETRIARDLKLSLVRLNSERQRQNVLQLCVLWRLLEQRKAGTRDFLETVQRIRMICEDVESRIVEGQAETVHTLCESVQTAIATLESCLQHEQPFMGKHRPDIFLAIENLGRVATQLAEFYVPGAQAPSKLFELDELAAKVDIRRCRSDILASRLESGRASSQSPFG